VTNEMTAHATLDIEFIPCRARARYAFRFHALVYASLIDNDESARDDSINSRARWTSATGARSYLSETFGISSPPLAKICLSTG